MPIRRFQLPGDVPLMLDIIRPAFEYPDHPEWNVQPDEVENMVDMLDTLRRLWPLFRVLRAVSPGLRHMMEGFIWEEDGQPVGLVNVIQRGTSPTWTIGNVAVLPAYRRRGIAQQLIAASVDLARQHGAEAVILDVVAGNMPAVKLYENLSFTAYRGSFILERPADTPPPAANSDPLPPDVTLAPLAPFDWRSRYELADRLTPDTIRTFEPVDARRFRQPLALRLVGRPILGLMGLKVRRYGLRDTSGTLLGSGGLQARTRPGGVNELWMMLDPAHGHLAEPLLNRLLTEVVALSPGRRIEMQMPGWQEAAIQAALAHDFRQMYAFTGMGQHVK